MPGLAEVPAQRPEPELAVRADHRDEMAQVISVAGELQDRLPVPRIGAKLSPHISREFGCAVVCPADSVVRPHRGEHGHQGAALVHVDHQRLAEEQQSATVEIDDRTAVGPCRSAPLVFLAPPQGCGVSQCEFRSADQRVEHAATAPVRVIKLPVLVFDDDEVRPVTHVPPVSDDASIASSGASVDLHSDMLRSGWHRKGAVVDNGAWYQSGIISRWA